MDFIAHFLWFFVLTFNKYLRKGRKYFGLKWNKTAGFVFAVAPDLALFPYLAFTGFYWVTGHTYAQSKSMAPLWVYDIYQFLHSYIFWAAVALLLYFAARSYFMPFLLGWGLHITIDVFLHQGHFANRPLYSLTTLVLNGFFEWDENWLFIVINFAVLACVLFWLWRKKGLTWKKFWKEVF